MHLLPRIFSRLYRPPINSLFATGCLAILSLLTNASPASAIAVYQYTGQNYQSTSSPYTTAMSIDGTITLASPLAPNSGVNLLGSISAFSFSDGVINYDQTNSALIFGTLSADGSGGINSWGIEIMTPGNVHGICSQQLTSNCPFFLGNGDAALLQGSIVAGTSVGSWALVPEPATLALTAVGLSALGLAATRRKRAWIA